LRSWHSKINSLKNSQAVKSGAAFKSLGEKICEIRGGGHKMAAMMLMLIKFLIMILCALIKLSTLTPLQPQNFSPRLLKAAPLFNSLAFLRGFHFFLYSNKAYWHISSYLTTYFQNDKKILPSPPPDSYQQTDILNVDI